MGASRPFGRAIGSSNSRPKPARDDTSASSGKERCNAFASHPVRSHPYVRSSFCRIERQNSSAASAYAATSRPVLPILAPFGPTGPG